MINNDIKFLTEFSQDCTNNLINFNPQVGFDVLSFILSFTPQIESFGLNNCFEL